MSSVALGDILSAGLRGLSWYTSHDYYVLIYLGLWIFVAWLTSSVFHLDPLYLAILISFIATIVIYFTIRHFLVESCSSHVNRLAREFIDHPAFETKTSLKLVDMTDREILKTLREDRSVKGDYLNLIREISTWFPAGELLARIGKLHALGYLKASRNRMTLTAEGLDLLELPQLIFRSNVPQTIATKVSEMRFALIRRNYNEVVDASNRIFESILREAFEMKFPDTYHSMWNDLQKSGVVQPEYERASLGHLNAAAKKADILKEGSAHDNLLRAFTKIRVPQKHEKGEPQIAEVDALNAIDIVNVFVRYWYR